MEWSILYFKGLLAIANSADPDDMSSYAAFRLGLHCLPKYLFSYNQNEKSQIPVILFTENDLFQFPA